MPAFHAHPLRTGATRTFGLAAIAVGLAGAGAAPASAAGGVEIVAPSAVAPVAGHVDFRLANAHDVARASFRVDGRVRDTDFSRPFRFGRTGLVDTTRLSNGKHRLTVSLKDRDGRKKSITRTVTVRNRATGVARAAALDTSAPSVSWKSPTAGQRVSGVRQLSTCEAIASDNVGVARVEFFADSTRLSTEYYAPYNCTWDTRKFSEGTHVLKAVAYDRAGNRRESTASVIVDNVPDAINPSPTISWSAPTSGATLAGTVGAEACEAKASDSNGVDRVEFAVNGRALNIERIAPYNCVLDTKTLTDGTHTLTATAYDKLGAKASSSVAVTVNNLVSAPTPAPSPAPTPSPTPTATPTPTPTPTSGGVSGAGDPAPASAPMKITSWRPVGTPPLSDAEAASRITRVPEKRSGNAAANAYKPSASELHAFLYGERNRDGKLPAEYSHLYGKVTGGFTGTTDEIIQWGAHKWGIPEDWIRAQAAKESWWRHSTQLGDPTTVRDVTRYPAHSRIDGTRVYQSLGLMQVRYDHPDGNRTGTGTEPLRWKSTAFNVDYTLATIRYYYDGLCSWCTAGYTAGQQWESLGAWYNPYPWKNSSQMGYVSSVQNNLANRVWEGSGF